MHFFLLLLLLTRSKTPCFAMRVPPTDQDQVGSEDSRSEYLERRLRTFRKATEDDLAASVGNVVFSQPFPADLQRGQAYLPQTVRDCYDQELVKLMPLRDDPNTENSFVAKSRSCIELFVQIKEQVKREEEEALLEDNEKERPVVPYKTKFAKDPSSPRDFFNAFSADPASATNSNSNGNGGRVPSAPSFDSDSDSSFTSDYPSATDPHGDTGPVVLAVVLIVGVVFLFFTCITCCAGAGAGGSETDADRRRDVENAIVEQVLKQQVQDASVSDADRNDRLSAAAAKKRDNLPHLYYNGLCWGATHASSFDAPHQPLTKGLSSDSTPAISPAPSGTATPTKKMLLSARHSRQASADRDDNSSNCSANNRRRQLLQMHTSQHTIEVAPSSKLERLLGHEAALIRSHSDCRGPMSASGRASPIRVTMSGPPSNSGSRMVVSSLGGLARGGRGGPHSSANSSFDV